MTARQVLLWLVLTVGMVGLLVWFGSRGATATTTNANDPNRPVATATVTTADLGSMRVSEIKQHSFSLQNTGRGDLALVRVATSCDCTYAYITVNGRRSAKQTMHGNDGLSETVKPGETAEVEVDYEPAIMPVHGPVQRTVSITTTDPVTPTVTFTVNANVTD